MTAPAARPPVAAGPEPAAPHVALRDELQRADAAIARRFDAGEDIDRLLHARSASVDAIVQSAWRASVDDVSGLALFAVGGYGRRELFPHSDVDLLVLIDDATRDAHSDALSRFFALLWDAGLQPGHAVRTLADNAHAVGEDITVFTAQLEARLLCGDNAHARPLADLLAHDALWPARDYFEAKREEQRARHARFDDTADNLEPNLKEGPGGLRDVHTLSWLAMRVAGVRDLEALVALGQLGADEYASIERERRALSRLRFGLHLVAGKREERLRFDYQKALAERLGHSGDAGNLAVEQMMQGFYRSATLVQRIGERVVQRFEEQLEGAVSPQPLDDTFELRHGYLAARDPAWPHGDIRDVFALFAAWARTAAARGLHSQTARALAESLPAMPSFEAADAAARADFMALLRGPQPVRTLERMARLGVLGAWLPAFARVAGRMQFDLFHVFTVDQHTLAVLRNIDGFASGKADARFAIAHDVWPRLRKPELLLLAALFHDIAKGRGGDHSELGAADARVFCATVGLPESDLQLVEWLVQRHLLMSTVAQKQDIGDPDVIHAFADVVADRDRLDYLYLLTCADIAGTSPKLWNTWKDRLLVDLYAATRAEFRRGSEQPVPADLHIAETQARARELLATDGMAPGRIDAVYARIPEQAFLRLRAEQIAWKAASLDQSAEATTVRVRPLGTSLADVVTAFEVFVHTPDRDGLFAAIVATLDRLGLAVLRARVMEAPDATAFDTFDVLPVDPARAVEPARIEQRLREVLSASLESVRPALRARPRHLRHFRIAPRIDFVASSNGRTALDLVCTDRPGLLADVAHVLRAQRLRVHAARVATFGERAEDVFQITDERDQPLASDRQQALRAALLDSLEGDAAQ